MKIYNFILDFLKVDCMWSVKTMPTYSRYMWFLLTCSTALYTRIWCFAYTAVEFPIRASFRPSPCLTIIYLASKIPFGSFLLGSVIRPSGEAPKIPFSFSFKKPHCVTVAFVCPCLCIISMLLSLTSWSFFWVISHCLWLIQCSCCHYRGLLWLRGSPYLMSTSNPVTLWSCHSAKPVFIHFLPSRLCSCLRLYFSNFIFSLEKASFYSFTMIMYFLQRHWVFLHWWYY